MHWVIAKQSASRTMYWSREGWDDNINVARRYDSVSAVQQQLDHLESINPEFKLLIFPMEDK